MFNVSDVWLSSQLPEVEEEPVGQEARRIGGEVDDNVVKLLTWSMGHRKFAHREQPSDRFGPPASGACQGAGFETYQKNS